MSDDYLWDGTGEPDPEIQELEQVLGTLRYQPRPLELPAQVRMRTFLPRMAIAAAVAAIVIGGTTWLLLNQPNAPVGLESTSNSRVEETLNTPPGRPTPSGNDSVLAKSPAIESPEIKLKRHLVRKGRMDGNQRSRAFKTELNAKQRVEGEAAKEQLLLALRVASEKLSLAQKKAQGGYPANLIRNQHKVG